ncbi:oxidoreductase [Bordetella pertussis]|nr:oxidoreductase [Bordetella pertussis]
MMATPAGMEDEAGQRARRTYVVSGSASGIGAATRRALEAGGATVIGIDLRNAEIEIDLSDAGQVGLVGARLAAQGVSVVDGVLTCAGVSGKTGSPEAIVAGQLLRHHRRARTIAPVPVPFWSRARCGPVVHRHAAPGPRRPLCRVPGWPSRRRAGSGPGRRPAPAHGVRNDQARCLGLDTASGPAGQMGPAWRPAQCRGARDNRYAADAAHRAGSPGARHGAGARAAGPGRGQAGARGRAGRVPGRSGQWIHHGADDIRRRRP